MKSKFEGVITAMVTPLRGEKKKIDLEATDSLVDFLIEKGVNGLFILGTFGEGMLLAVDERRKLTERVINHVNKRVLVIVHVSHMEIERTEELIEHARDKGADAVALLPPFFYLQYSLTNCLENQTSSLLILLFSFFPLFPNP